MYLHKDAYWEFAGLLLTASSSAGVLLSESRCWTPQLRTRAHDRDRTGDLFLTKEVLYRLSYVSRWFVQARLERETGFEPATLSLEG
jgi:hypothetical protein